jgi:hypothetical protein
MAVPKPVTLLAGLFVAALPFFYECRHIAIRSALFELIGFLFSAAAICLQNFAAAISIAAGCLAALVMNRSHSRKNFVP